MAARFHYCKSRSEQFDWIPGFGHVLDAGTHRNSLILHAPRGTACNNFFGLFILMYEKLVPGRLFSHQVLQSNEMDVPRGYDEAPFSGSSTSTLSTPLLNCENYMSADNAHQAENSATTTETRLEQVPVDNSASASGSGTNSSSSRLLNVTNMRDVKEQEQVVTRMAVARQFFIAHEYKPPPQTQAERFMAMTTRAHNVILQRHLNSTMRQTRRLRRGFNSSNFKKAFLSSLWPSTNCHCTYV